MIRLHNLQKNYPPDQCALDSVTLTVHPGEFVFVVGASGAGKSTLLKLLFGSERPSSGDLVVGGRKLTSLDKNGIAALRRETGFIFQDYKLLHRKTVLDNVIVPLEIRGLARSKCSQLAKHLLDTFGLSSKTNMYPQSLSGGEQQRVAIARALIHRPRLVLADEPTGNLDPDMARYVFDLLLEANAYGVTVVVATHDLATIEDLNLRTIVLDRGKLIGDFDRPRRLR